MNFKNIFQTIKEFFAREYIEQIDELKNQVNIMDDEIDELLSLIEELGEEQKQEEKESEEALEWNSVWKTSDVAYAGRTHPKTKKQLNIDVKDFISNNSSQLKSIVSKYN